MAKKKNSSNKKLHTQKGGSPDGVAVAVNKSSIPKFPTSLAGTTANPVTSLAGTTANPVTSPSTTSTNTTTATGSSTTGTAKPVTDLVPIKKKLSTKETIEIGEYIPKQTPGNSIVTYVKVSGAPITEFTELKTENLKTEEEFTETGGIYTVTETVPTIIDLRENQLEIPRFPREILYLPYLVTLIMDGTDEIKGGIQYIPSDIDRLVNLRCLSLKNNQIKEIPDSLTSLVYNLEVLDLSGNQLLKEIPGYVGKDKDGQFINKYGIRATADFFEAIEMRQLRYIENKPISKTVKPGDIKPGDIRTLTATYKQDTVTVDNIEGLYTTMVSKREELAKLELVLAEASNEDKKATVEEKIKVLEGAETAYNTEMDKVTEIEVTITIKGAEGAEGAEGAKGEDKETIIKLKKLYLDLSGNEQILIKTEKTQIQAAADPAEARIPVLKFKQGNSLLLRINKFNEEAKKLNIIFTEEKLKYITDTKENLVLKENRRKYIGFYLRYVRLLCDIANYKKEDDANKLELGNGETKGKTYLPIPGFIDIVNEIGTINIGEQNIKALFGLEDEYVNNWAYCVQQNYNEVSNLVGSKEESGIKVAEAQQKVTEAQQKVTLAKANPSNTEALSEAKNKLAELEQPINLKKNMGEIFTFLKEGGELSFKPIADNFNIPDDKITLIPSPAAIEELLEENQVIYPSTELDYTSFLSTQANPQSPNKHTRVVAFLEECKGGIVKTTLDDLFRKIKNKEKPDDTTYNYLDFIRYIENANIVFTVPATKETILNNLQKKYIIEKKNSDNILDEKMISDIKTEEQLAELKKQHSLDMYQQIDMRCSHSEHDNIFINSEYSKKLITQEYQKLKQIFFVLDNIDDIVKKVAVAGAGEGLEAVAAAVAGLEAVAGVEAVEAAVAVVKKELTTAKETAAAEAETEDKKEAVEKVEALELLIRVIKLKKVKITSTTKIKELFSVFKDEEIFGILMLYKELYEKQMIPEKTEDMEIIDEIKYITKFDKVINTNKELKLLKIPYVINLKENVIDTYKNEGFQKYINAAAAAEAAAKAAAEAAAKAEEAKPPPVVKTPDEQKKTNEKRRTDLLRELSLKYKPSEDEIELELSKLYFLTNIKNLTETYQDIFKINGTMKDLLGIIKDLDGLKKVENQLTNLYKLIGYTKKQADTNIAKATDKDKAKAVAATQTNKILTNYLPKLTELIKYIEVKAE